MKLLNYIKSLFYKDSKQVMNNFSQQMINKIIKELTENPQNFTALWFNKKRLDTTITNKNKTIIIAIETGYIIAPHPCIPTPEVTKQIKKLLAPIILKETKHILENI